MASLPKLPAGSDGTVVLGVRARLTLDEWTRFRTRALSVNAAASDLLGDVIRNYLAAPLNPKGTDTDVTDTH